ncbi:MAG TPA: thioesterase family protein [Thermoanaerobaculia bacterium]|nr:thioesterase family protein [Thermoanaerobaculia bacterium]
MITRDLFRLLEPIAVRWGDMDSMGHVNNAKYFTYCESARMRYFAAIGMDRHQEGAHGPALVAATLNFRRQVHYPAELEVGTRVVQVGRSSFEQEYAVFRCDTGEVVADGTSVCAWVDYAAGRAAPLPAGLREAMRRWEAGEVEGPEGAGSGD